MAARNDLVAIPQLNNYSAEYAGDSYGLAQYVGDIAGKTGIAAAIALLRKFGSNAHLWLPGVGTINGLSTGNYLESTGNTVLTVDNPAGLVLDALGSVGSELFSVAGCTVGTGWSIAGDTLVSAGNNAFESAYKNIGMVAGVTYKITFTVARTAGSLLLRVGSGVNKADISASGTYSYVLPAEGAILYFMSNASGFQFQGVISSISVREVTGIHLTQATTASKPILRRGLTNLLTYSSDFSNAVWQKTDLSAVAWTIGANVADPFGGTNAVTMVISGSRIFRAPSVPSVSGAIYTQYLWVRSSATGGASNIRLTTNNTSAWNTGSSEKIALSQSWTLVARSGVAQTGASTAHVMFGCLDAAGSVDATCLGNIDVYAAGFTLGTLTAQQIIDAGGIPTTTTAAASNPSAGRYSWGFDGSNDYLTLGSVPFQAQDDFAVIAGFSRSATGSNPRLFAIGSAGAALFRIYCISATNIFYASLADDAGVNRTIVISGALAPGNAETVISYKKTGANKVGRTNGVLVASDAGAIGSSTFTSANIGAEIGPLSHFPGTIGPVLAIKGTVTDAELLLLERFVAALTPNGPVF